VFNIAMLTVLD